MGYKITKETKDCWLWDLHAEMAIANLANMLYRYDESNDRFKIVRQLNFDYLRKTNRTNINNYGPTRIQKDMLKNFDKGM